MSSDSEPDDQSLGTFEEYKQNEKMPKGFKIPKAAKLIGENLWEAERVSPGKNTKSNKFINSKFKPKDRYYMNSD